MARPNGMFMQRPNMAPVMNMPMNNMNRPVQYPGHMNQMNQELPSGYKLNQGVRNNMQAYDPSMGMVPQQMPNMQMNQMQQQQPDMHANTGSGDQVHNEVPRNTLDPAELARIPAQDQKQLIGEKLYPLVQEFCDETEAGKVTGMILELENEELLALLENTSQIRDKVLEAKNVLDSHANNQPGQEIQAAH
jgi:polyadenylate-binding protein